MEASKIVNKNDLIKCMAIQFYRFDTQKWKLGREVTILNKERYFLQ